VASNGDLRLEPTPGQWQPVPKQHDRAVDRAANEISVTLSYPDPEKHRKGFNPIEYPDLSLSYKVRVRGEGAGFRILVDLDKPLPAEWVGRVGFNFELFPGALFGRSWYLDDRSGLFPRQPDGPVRRDASGEVQPVPMATGRRLTVAPEADAQRLVVESRTGDLQLLDGRTHHNNGWFVVRSLVGSNATRGAIDWLVQPSALPGWKHDPVVQVSQVGYHPAQEKVAVIETDASETTVGAVTLKRASETGTAETVLSGAPSVWGKFLRYRYLRFDFSKVTRPGVYFVEYGGRRTEPFRIAADVYASHVWQPTLEYFLPVQMCHVRVVEGYKTWHGACHLDDALMAPTSINHFDGYVQGPSTLTKYAPGDAVPGLDVGGWHDAGDDDFRIESQADEVWLLAATQELFKVDYDVTTVDQARRTAEIHRPDGKPDLLQQIEHGVLTILGGYKSLGRLYRGVIVPTIPQYVHLGDTVNYSDNLVHDPKLKEDERTATHSGKKDDRWVFTEENPGREYKGIAALAIAGRVLKEYDPALARECVTAAEALWKHDRKPGAGFDARVAAATELLLTTGRPEYGRALLDDRKRIVERVDSVGWMAARALPAIRDTSFAAELRAAAASYFARVEREQGENPYGVPYKPVIWGAGWGVQEFGVRQYFLHRAFPDAVSPKYMLNALNFVLGVHPGTNTASFASGVGSRSMTVAYGLNRADWTYIPGGVVSGTALIRPDFPEMKDFPYLWQQAEYVMGGGSSNFMFLVLAADRVLGR
jgi:endoglucanase